MKVDKHRWLSGVIAAHPDHQVVGRTRLQKTIRILQRLGLPTDYQYKLFFYGPYSEGVHADVGLLEAMGLVSEEERQAQDGSTYYIIKANPESDLPAIQEYRSVIEKLALTDPTVLELAATYDAFRELGDGHEEALTQLRRKKGVKCEQGRENKALQLLQQLGLSKNWNP